MKRPMTENEAYNKCAAYCSTAERCNQDILEKLIRWGIDQESSIRIIAKLTKENYLNEARFCRSFTNDKYRFAKWGKNKIRQALLLKRLPGEEIDNALQHIQEEEYRDNLKTLLAQKKKSIHAKNEYELKCKLIRFATGRGFSLGEISKYLNTDEFTEMD